MIGPTNAQLASGKASSGPFAESTAGDYRWVAVYSGDANNDSSSGACGDQTEISTVTAPKASPTISTQATNGTAGGTISDTATLTGGNAPQGTVTFNVYGPNDSTCAGAIFATKTATVSNGQATSPPVTVNSVGTYSWTASYGGDANNNGVAGTCGASNETSTVTKATPSLSTSATSATLGGSISDTATVTGASATGTVTFTAYGPSDTSCTGTPVFGPTPAATLTNGSASSGSFTPPAPGTYRWTASYSGDANNNAVTGTCNAPNESSTVGKVTPAVSTQVSKASAGIGDSLSDTATMSNGVNPTGTIIFRAFGPGDSSCTGTPAFTSTKSVSGNGSYTSDTFTPTQAGTYHWIATYSGDGNNNTAADLCSDANEAVAVAKATPSITTRASASGSTGGTISDAATVTGANPTGTVVFRVYGPADSNCTASPLFTSSAQPLTNGSASSGAFSPQAPGTYHWIATYSGDANNNAVAGTCADANEASVVGKGTPLITTSATSGAVGGTIADQATVTGAGPTGSVTFSVYGPADTSCTGTPVFTSSARPLSNGSASSGPFSPNAPGTYRWVASYSGDANNNAATAGCNGANESSTVDKAAASLTTAASPAVPVGGNIHDDATLSGGASPTGTITFRLFGPSDTTCAGPPIGTWTAQATGDGTYSSAAFTTGAAGTYRFIATYAGDTNNNGAAGICNASGESVDVSKLTPAMSTQATQSAPAGGTIIDTATLTGGAAPTGTVTFKVYGPSDATCSGTPFATTSAAVTNGTATSPPVAVSTAGTYRWIASYSGDASNNAVTGACNAANEASTVTTTTPRGGPAISSQASGAVAVGGLLTDSATLSGATRPKGAIVFRLFGPDDSTCSTAPKATSTTRVRGNGTYSSAPYRATAPGTYRWIASFSGDRRNSPVSGACNDPSEASTVIAPKATPTLPTSATGSVSVGMAISDTATLSGATNPTGSITFRVFGPSDAACSGPPSATSTRTVNGNGGYTSDPYTATTAGTYHWIASYSGDANNNAVAGACNDSNEASVVTAPPAPKTTPTLATRASASVPAGGGISDTATLTGGATPTGTMTFQAFGPDDASCSATPAASFVQTVNGSGTYASGTYTAMVAGTYRWIASYSGDANNNAVAGACNGPSESVVVSRATTAIGTRASGTTPAGSPISDTAVLSGGASPTGTITFQVFGPDDTTCATAPKATSTRTVGGNGSYTSDPYTPTLAGTYRWIAAYSGDANNAPITGACNDANEAASVTRAATAVDTQASRSVAVGSPIADTATVHGGANPTGTVAFTAYGPNDTSCSGTPAVTSTKAVSGNGTAASDPFTPTAPGTYRWVASYSGDANNNGANDPCNAANESVLVTPPPADLAVTKGGPARAVPGSNVTYTLTLHNNGPGDAANPVLTDALPSDTLFVSLNQTSGPAFSCTTPDQGVNGTMRCSAAKLANGDTASFQLVLRLTPVISATITNTASTSSDTPDPDSSNNTASTTLRIRCDHTLLGPTSGNLTLNGGFWCIQGDVSGNVTFGPGTSVLMVNSHVNGNVTSTQGGVFLLCNTAISGDLSVTGASDFVLIGDSLDDACLPDAVSGNLTLSNDTGGVEVVGATVSGNTTIRNSLGGGPYAEDVMPEIESTATSGNLTCDGNTPPVTDDGRPDSVSGNRFGC